MTSCTDQMFKILNESYERRMGQPIQTADLGHSTDNFNFFVTSSISRSLTLTSGGSAKGSGLMTKLIDMMDDKCEIVDSIIEKISAGTYTKKVVISLDSFKNSSEG